MIKVTDNRKTNECILDNIEAGKFFMVNDFLYRACWWEPETFDTINYEYDTRVCMRMYDGTLCLWRYDKVVTPISERQVEIIVED